MTKAEKFDRLYAEAIGQFNAIQDTVRTERLLCLSDRRFYSIPGAQWEDLKDQFENSPRFEVNKIHMSIMRHISEYRNNRISVNFVSKDGSDKSKLADVCNGLFRSDEQDSLAEEAYDNAFEEAVGGGFSAIRVCEEYEDEEDDDNDDVRIKIEPIYEADSVVFFDLASKRYDKSDAKYCFVMTSMSHEEFAERWGEAPTSVDKTISMGEFDWITPDLVWVAEWYKIEEKRELVRVFKDLLDEETKFKQSDFDDDPELEAELISKGYQEVRSKRILTKKVHKYIISGSKVLEDCGYIAGKCIPIVPVYGKRWFVDGVERCMGHVRLAKDAQRLKNVQLSKLGEISALSPIPKPIFTPEQVAGHEYRWAEDNTKNYPYMLTNPITDAMGNQIPSGPLAYTQPPQIPPALGAIMQVTEQDIKEILGQSAQQDQVVSNISGKAVEMIQTRMDMQTFIYMSNLAKSLKRLGEVWLSKAKELYTRPGRVMKTVGGQGETSSVELYRPITSESGAPEVENDLTEASFDVVVDVGPSSTSKREATVRALSGMLAITQDQADASVLRAMALMNMEGEGIGDVKEYFRKKMVSMGVMKPTEEDKAEMQGNQKPDPNAVALEAMADQARAEASKARADVVKTIAETEKIQADTEKSKAQTLEIVAGVDQSTSGVGV